MAALVLLPSICIISHRRWALQDSNLKFLFFLFLLQFWDNWIFTLSCQELQLYLSDVANKIDRDSGVEQPLVVIIDDISDPAAISELVNGALTCKYHKWWVSDNLNSLLIETLRDFLCVKMCIVFLWFSPYIIGTTNQPVKMLSNHGLHLSFR